MHNVDLDFSRPGKLTDNAFIESFNGKFRGECLNTDWFLSLHEAQRKWEAWKNMQCNVCLSTEFAEMNGRANVRCKACNSLERTRVLKLLLDEHGLVQPGMRVLHFALEGCLALYLRGVVGSNYDPVDIDPERYSHVGVRPGALRSDSS